MKYLCIAASNSRKPLAESVSYKVCKLAETLIHANTDQKEQSVECISLKDFNMNVCTLCGACSKTGQCSADPDFNALLEKMTQADRLFFVVPHYSPLPAKLMILFEKLNEQSYSGWLNDPAYQSPIQGKSFAVVGHGGMTETPEVLSYYHETLVKPITRTLKSLGLVHAAEQADRDQNNVFGLLNDDCLQSSPKEIFPNIVLDEFRIIDRITPVIEELTRFEKA